MRFRPFSFVALVAVIILVSPFGRIPDVHAAAVTLFSDDFEDGTAAAWLCGTGGGWFIQNGVYVFDNDKGTACAAINTAGDENWTDYTYDVDIQGAGQAIYKRIYARFRDVNNYYAIDLRAAPANDLKLFKHVNGVRTELQSVAYANVSNVRYHLQVVLTGERIVVFVNGTRLIDHTDQGTSLTHGKIGLLAGEDGGKPRYDNVVVSTAAVIALSPTSLSFSAQPIGTPSGARTTKLTNKTAGPVALGAVTLVGSYPQDYRFTSDCSTSLPAFSSCTLSVIFRPTVVGTRPATLSINHGAVGGPALLPLSGVGTSNLISNPAMESDDDLDGKPDFWSTNSAVVRTSTVVRTGRYAMEHSAPSDSNYTVSQRITGIQQGQPYGFRGWINIPPTADEFTFDISLQWFDASKVVLRTDSIQQLSGGTNGWERMMRQFSVPVGAASARLKLRAASLLGPVYLDDLYLGNLLVNGGFEQDVNGDARPDVWTIDPHVTRSTEVMQGGSFSMKHTATTAATYHVGQRVLNELKAGQAYTLSAAVNVPQPIQGGLQLEVTWIDANGLVISGNVTSLDATATTGWRKITAVNKAPAGTRSALIRVKVTGLVGTVYMDDVALWP